MGVKEDELQKVKKKTESTFEFGKTSVLNIAMGLAISSLTESAQLFNEEIVHYNKVTCEDIVRVAKEILTPDNRSKLIYKAKKR